MVRQEGRGGGEGHDQPARGTKAAPENGGVGHDNAASHLMKY